MKSCNIFCIIMYINYLIDNDLSTREYNLQYAAEAFEKSLMLEVVDDNIAENEETFIIYTSIVESAGDDCARAIHLHDNDGVCLHLWKLICVCTHVIQCMEPV